MTMEKPILTSRSAESDYASFGAMLKRTWHEFSVKFWTLVGVEVFFGAVALFLLYLFFGSAALKVIGESLKAGTASGLSSSNLYTLIRLSNAAYAVAVPAVVLTLLFDVFHQGALFSLAVQPERQRRRFRATLREGLRTAWKFGVFMVLLIVAIAIINAMLALLARGIFHYTGDLQVGATRIINQLILLAFSFAMLAAFLIYVFSGMHITTAQVTLRRALTTSIQALYRAPWELTWRAALYLLLLYIMYQLASTVTFSLGAVSLQSIISVFIIPFSIIFARELYEVFCARRHVTGPAGSKEE